MTIPQPRPVEFKPTDEVAEYARALRKHLREDMNWAAAEDRVLATHDGAALMRRALHQFALTPRVLPNGHRSGQGSLTATRSVEGFRAHVQNLEA